MRARSTLLCVAVFALAASARAADPAPLRVGTSGDYAPFSKDGQGFDVDFAKLWAAALGRPLQLVPFRWPELAERAARGDFDVAMSGITWRADRDVHGWLSLAIGQGGPCWIGPAEPTSVAVNRGGVLESFAHLRFPNARIVAVDDNASLPALLAAGSVQAIVTDSFEIGRFRKPGDTSLCVSETFRKVYWIAPQAAAELGPALDRFIASHERDLAALRERWFGADQPRPAPVHLVDLIARRLELMDAVGAWKRANDKPIADPEQEARVLARVDARAVELGLAPEPVHALFLLEIALAKKLEAVPHPGTPNLDLDGELRPAIARLSERQLQLLAEAAPLARDSFDTRALAPLQPLLEPGDVEAMRNALAGVRRAK
ncbi:MAG TPA: transporter substrate-binding domain-containing protein [Myxococcota bacterium]|nr:transporter substrate-binding domain-containing protein [Myxococcota bacterium]